MRRRIPRRIVTQEASMPSHSSQQCALPLVEVQIPASNEEQYQIATNEGSQYSEISPPGVEADSKRLVELVANFVCAVCTVRGLIVGKISRTTGGEEVGHVLATRLAGRRRKAIVLRVCTSHF